jgi:hypothetical protein
MSKRGPDLNLSGWQASYEEALPRIAHIRHSAIPVAATLVLIGTAIPLEAHADPFGPCAHRRNLEEKTAACIKAARSTSYPWILQWVHRELARSHRERGEIREAIISYEQSLAAGERDEVRREMEELSLSAP